MISALRTLIGRCTWRFYIPKADMPLSCRFGLTEALALL